MTELSASRYPLRKSLCSMGVFIFSRRASSARKEIVLCSTLPLIISIMEVVAALSPHTSEIAFLYASESSSINLFWKLLLRLSSTAMISHTPFDFDWGIP